MYYVELLAPDGVVYYTSACGPAGEFTTKAEDRKEFRRQKDAEYFRYLLRGLQYHNYVLSVKSTEETTAMHYECSDDWVPTPDAINALPAPLRRHIAQIETLCDPSGMVREIAQLKDVQRELVASNRMLRAQLAKREAAQTVYTRSAMAPAVWAPRLLPSVQDEIKARVLPLVSKREMLTAIRTYRDIAGCSLLEAKGQVEKLRDQEKL